MAGGDAVRQVGQGSAPECNRTSAAPLAAAEGRNISPKKRVAHCAVRVAQRQHAHVVDLREATDMVAQGRNHQSSADALNPGTTSPILIAL